LLARLKNSGIAVDENRSAHLLAHAEIEKIICSGPIHNGKHTYALLLRRVPHFNRLSKEESLAVLARRYFTSRCPATMQDFLWWSGLPAKDARLGLELIKTEFHPEQIGEHTYWMQNDRSIPSITSGQVHLLPPYDELIVSYIDRNASIPAELDSFMKEISDRGVFRPIIVVDGKVAGIWKRSNQKDRLNIEAQLYTKVEASTRALITKASTAYGSFCGKPADINYLNQGQ